MIYTCDIAQDVKYITISTHFNECTVHQDDLMISEHDIERLLVQYVEIHSIFYRKIHMPALLLLALFQKQNIEDDIVHLSFQIPFLKMITNISLENSTKFKQSIQCDKDLEDLQNIEDPQKIFQNLTFHSRQSKRGIINPNNPNEYSTDDRLAFRIFFSVSLETYWGERTSCIDYNTNDISVCSIIVDGNPFEYFTFEWYGKTIYVISFIQNNMGDVINNLDDISELLESGSDNYSFYYNKNICYGHDDVSIDIIYPENFKGVVNHINVFSNTLK